MALLSTVWYAFLALVGLSIRPDSPPTDGIAGVRGICSGLSVRDGSVSCFGNGLTSVCQVECDGKNYGQFTCTTRGGWTPELPPCAKPIEDNSSAEDCETNVCHESCTQQGYKNSVCRPSCICY